MLQVVEHVVVAAADDGQARGRQGLGQARGRVVVRQRVGFAGQQQLRHVRGAELSGDTNQTTGMTRFEAVSGKTVEVHYVGVSWKNGNQFDASWDRGDTFKFGLGKGDRVLIEKAGEIIPQILAVMEKGEGPAFVTPTACPSCQSELVREDGKVALVCPNRLGCPAPGSFEG